jgi:hypothetical protein
MVVSLVGATPRDDGDRCDSRIVWGSRKPASLPQLDPLASTMSAIEPVAFVAVVREAEPNRTMPLEPLEPLELLEPLESSESSEDFDRSLPAIVAMEALTIDALAPANLTEEAPLTLTPLAIADLPLTAESNSPR